MASPCIGRCALNEERVCVGCFRHIGEISGWGLSDADARRKILARCRQRRQEALPSLSAFTARLEPTP